MDFEIAKLDDVWHLVDPNPYGMGEHTLCTGEPMDERLPEQKTYKKGSITCEKCKRVIKIFKSIKL